MGALVTGSGEAVRCDGCGAALDEDLDPRTQVWPIEPEIGARNYGRTDLVYLVCPPRGGVYACLDLARLGEEMYQRLHAPGCGCDEVRGPT